MIKRLVIIVILGALAWWVLTKLPAILPFIPAFIWPLLSLLLVVVVVVALVQAISGSNVF